MVMAKEKTTTIPDEYLIRMKSLLGAQYDDYIKSLKNKPRRGLWVNTLKTTIEQFLKDADFSLLPIKGVEGGFLLKDDVMGIGAHPLHRAGVFYMQEPSAMKVTSLLEVKPGMKVLDLCAAPGGKAGRLSLGLKGEGLLVANELDKSRGMVLKNNLERLGVTNAVVTSMHPDLLCFKLKGFFDRVLVDAPCSGEGMFRKDENAIKDWSLAHVRACAIRQAKILNSAAVGVKPGGLLLYSTCTFSKEENEDRVDEFLKTNRDFELIGIKRLYPHTCDGEGQFMALFKKGEGRIITYDKLQTHYLKKDEDKIYKSFVEDCFYDIPKGNPKLLADGRLILLNVFLPVEFSSLHILHGGIFVGELKKDRIVPGQGLCMAMGAKAFKRCFMLNSGEVEEYLKGNVIQKDISGDGYGAVCAMGYPIGWGKMVKGVIKNLLPKGQRLYGGAEKRADKYGEQ